MAGTTNRASDPEQADGSMNALMNPTSIAVVGASQRRSRGTRVLLALKTTGFSGGVFGVNPKYDETEGFPCFPTISDIPEPVDCVVAAVPAPSVPDALEDAFECGVRSAVILSSGFGEGGHENADRVGRIRDLAAKGMAICGPNCYGILNLSTGSAAFSGNIEMPLVEGPIGLISQSGGFTNTISQPLMVDRGIGFSYLISCGNQLGVSVEDYIGYLIDDPGTRVIAAFVEGFRKPERLPDLAAKAHRADKPIIVLKPGRSMSGMAAARSHTGSLAGGAEVASSLLRRYGYVQVGGIDELVETIALFTVLTNKGTFTRDIIVVTGGGGEGSHISDAAEEANIALAPLAPETQQQLSEIMPDFGNTALNPVDGTGVVFEDPTVFPAIIKAVLSDPHTGAVAVNISARRSRRSNMTSLAESLAEAAKASDKIIMAYSASSLGELNHDLLSTLASAGVPYVGGSQYAMKVLASLYAYRQFQTAFDPGEVSPGTTEMSLRGKHKTSISRSGILSFMEARDLLLPYGVPIVPTEFAANAEAAAEAAEALGYPVAVKVEADGIVHRSYIGGVVLGCSGPNEVKRAFREVSENARAHGATAIQGVLVQTMNRPGVETIAGVTVDSVFGPAVLFGLGGIFAEVINHTRTEVLPLSVSRAREMVLGILGCETTLGARRKPPADIDSVAHTLVGLAEFAQAYRDQLVSVDLNPLIVGPEGSGSSAVDVFIEVK